MLANNVISERRCRATREYILSKRVCLINQKRRNIVHRGAYSENSRPALVAVVHLNLLGVVNHSLEINHNHWFISNHPAVVARW